MHLSYEFGKGSTMMNSAEFQQIMETLAQNARVTEYDFRSNLPVIGPFVQRFRQIWNAISTRWYVRDYACQQVQFQMNLLRIIESLHAENQELCHRLNEAATTISVLNVHDAMLKQDIDSIVRQFSLHK